jgi:8-oxo-dGTP diphosphatase
VTDVHVIRHALAGDRRLWDGPDELRPLTEQGWEQAEAIARRDGLPAFVRLLSSPYVRCVESLEPLSSVTGIPIEARPELAEGASHASLEPLIVDAAAGGPAAVCVHGDQLEHLAVTLDARGIRPRGRSDIRKGCTWVLDVRGGSVVGARYLPLPTPADRAAIVREA